MGGAETFLVMYWGGGENKKLLGQVGHIFHQVFGKGCLMCLIDLCFY